MKRELESWKGWEGHTFPTVIFQCSEGKKLRLIYISSFSKEEDDAPCALFTHRGFEAETIL